jgi:acetyl/propionyl-CoA carboxylase alpha subunit
MIKKLLIANRGEIVSRIIRACRDLGIKTVAVYSDADEGALFARQADEAFNIGPGNPMKSYLNIDAILDAGKRSGADAVHPGYGFLSESLSFAAAVGSMGMTWVGPPAAVLEAIESKCYCRQIADRAGVPVNPGTLNSVKDAEEISRYAREVGFPIFLKLDKGGGGKGIEIVEEETQIQEVFERVSRIGLVAFHSSDVYIEKVLANPRHIEVQFLADQWGNCVCLGERECSIQRRHQKIIEESPSPVVTEGDRDALFTHTLRLVRSMGYQGAGTMEFLRAENGNYYFMEINARLQVEHPVSEMLTGIDIVKGQLEIASGEKLGIAQEEVVMKGHAIEARVYAEDPVSFQPSPGPIEELRLPEETESLRIDHALEQGGSVPPYYDPLLAKVIARGTTRSESSNRLIEGLNDFHVKGIRTTIPINLMILKHQDFVNGNYHTGFIEAFLEEGR